MKNRDPSWLEAMRIHKELEEQSDLNLVFSFREELMQMYLEGGRPCLYFNNTITTKLRAFDVLEKDNTYGRSNKTKVSRKGLELVRKFSKLDNVRNTLVVGL